MTILIILLITIFSVWGWMIAKSGRGQIPFASELEEPADGYTESVCRNCGGKMFSIKVTDIEPLGVIKRSITEVICQICGKTAFKTFNSYRENDTTLH